MAVDENVHGEKRILQFGGHVLGIHSQSKERDYPFLARDSSQCVYVISHFPQRRMQLSRHEVQTLLEKRGTEEKDGEKEKRVKDGVGKGSNRGGGCGQ